MDIVITIRDSTHDGRSHSPNDFLPAAYAAVASIKAQLPIDDGVSLLSIGLEADPQVLPVDEQLPEVDLAEVQRYLDDVAAETAAINVAPADKAEVIEVPPADKPEVVKPKRVRKPATPKAAKPKATAKRTAKP